uniref:Uncharacterized protein n=1 Tax=Stegastes partitus TaxID=144197 RepID=A0A3B5A5I9_9TELE
MPRGKSYRRSQAVQRRLETQRTLNVAPQQGTGYRHAVRRWPTSLVTGRSHKLVIPAEVPNKKFVLLVGASHLRSIADGIVAMPEGGLSFGVMSTPGAAAAELRAEFLSTVLPRKPDAVLLQAPSNNLTSSSTIQEAGADFSKLLASVCSQHTNVVVTDFTPRLNIDLSYQQHLRQEYHRVAASMGVKYFSVVEYFPLKKLELNKNLYQYFLQVLQPPAPKPQTPRRTSQRRSLPRVVVKGEVTKPRPPVNPFEWTLVTRGQKVKDSSVSFCDADYLKVLCLEQVCVVIAKGEPFLTHSFLLGYRDIRQRNGSHLKPRVERKKRVGASKSSRLQQKVSHFINVVFEAVRFFGAQYKVSKEQ